ncbi:antibiotic biosynthesis monooxygenase [Pseudomonas sp. PDM14]|uniref:antibiotic biosynthesis monooxygenase n=1 Tax=Pseudomonas sp. PDM14 TaxID=2769288 RepID=UPI001783CC4C|nr:antibiotic biosynthesis monooxygenase [Pseudomonas sp. PDM14]MBD9484960.1 antibiotic biosynthesis monooxygenase [Pseudomonas sp. PDM14]
MSADPVTFMVARRVPRERFDEFRSWLHEGELLAADYPGYLGSGVLAPPPDDDEFQIVFRFADEATLTTWVHSEARGAWLQRGSGLFSEPQELHVRGLDAWFGSTPQKPPRWKQSVAIWLAFFPVSLGFNLLFGGWLGELPLALRILLSTLALTPLMTYWFIPLSTRLLEPWLQARQRHAQVQTR